MSLKNKKVIFYERIETGVQGKYFLDTQNTQKSAVYG